MATCLRHKHSSQSSADKCWAKYMQKRGDKRLTQSGVLQNMPVYEQCIYVVPKVVKHVHKTVGGSIEIEIYYFAEGKRIK